MPLKSCLRFLVPLFVWAMVFMPTQSWSNLPTDQEILAPVSGTVINADGDPLVGATVLVKGTTVGALTDSDGKYRVDVPEGSGILVISFIGYKTKEVAINGRSVVIDR